MNRFSTLAVPRREPEAGGEFFAYVWSTLGGLLVPVLIVLTGLIASLLNAGGLTRSTIRLGTHLWVPLPAALLGEGELVQLSILVAATLAVGLLFSLAVWMNRRAADGRARRIVKQLHRRVLNQSLKRAELEGAAAQHYRAEKLIAGQLPSLQAGLSLWYRVIPRNLLMLLGCVALALLVNVWLAVLAVVSGVLVWQLYRWLRAADDSDLSHWEVPRMRRRMAEIVGRAPLLARLQSQGVADQTFAAELEALYRKLAADDARKGRLWPVLFAAASIAIAILLLGLGVNLLGVHRGLSLPAALVLGLSLTAAAVSAGRLVELANQLGQSRRASESVYLYLQRGDEIAPSEQRVGLAGLREGVGMHDVTLNDSGGHPILSNLSLSLSPGSLVAVLGTEAVSTRALAELLMGFGRPAEGRLEIDGIPLLDVHPQALARNVMWIEPDGPLWDGTILENLQGGDHAITNSDIMETLSTLGVYERIQRLPDGLNTIVAAGDSTLGVETTYALGVARAVLHGPPIVLAMEPLPPAEHLAEDPCMDALRRLVQSGSLVVVLPRRLPTLRAADRVVLLNGPRLVGEGRHAELLSDSDLYRHLNYLLFNPYRHQRRD